MLRALAAMLYTSWNLVSASLQHVLQVSIGLLKFEG